MTKGAGTIYNTFSTYGYELGNAKEMKKGEWEMTRDDLGDAMRRIPKLHTLKPYSKEGNIEVWM